MTPDADRLNAFADGLASAGEESLSDLVRAVADGLAKARGDDRMEAEE